MSSSALRGILRTALAAVTGVALSVPLATPASAVDVYQALAAWSGPSYVYVNAGESLSITSRQTGASYTVTRPDGTNAPMTGSAGVVATCTVTATVPCTFTEAATSEGVWRVTRAGGPVSTTLVEDISVLGADGATIPGRLWLDQANLNTGNQYGTANSAFYVLSDYGVRYRITLPAYQPWGATLSASNKGIMEVGTCLPTYHSVPINNEGTLVGANYTSDGTGCADYVPYRIFPEVPDPSMPATVAQWADGRTAQTWVHRLYQTPAITAASFTRSGTTSDAGTFTGTLAGQPGRVSVQLDVDGNGVYTDAVDVTLPPIVTALGAFSAPWDGKDGLGNLVSALIEVPFRMTYSGEAEIHFVMIDSEGRTGGISMTRLNGPGAPDARINWDDSLLTKRSSDGTVPNPLTGVLVDSTTPVHAWSRGIPTNLAYGWGDLRRIEDWAAVTSAVQATGVIPALTQALSVTKTVDAVAPVAPGSTLTYTVKVTNVGTAAYTPTLPGVVTDTVVAGGGSVADPVTSTPGAVVTTDTITWTISDLAVGASTTLTYTATVQAADQLSGLTVTDWAFAGTSAPTSCTATTRCAAAEVTIAVPTPTPTPSPTATPTSTPTPTAAPPAGTLPQTGTDASLLPLGVGLGIAALGLAVVALAARRRES